MNIPLLMKNLEKASIRLSSKSSLLNSKPLEFLNPSTHVRLYWKKTRWFIAVFVNNTTAWKLKEKTAQTTNDVTWPDLRTSHGQLIWNFLSWDWVLAPIIPFSIMLFMLPVLYGLPFQLHNKVFKINSMWRGNKRIIFQIFSIQKITDMLSSNHHLFLYTKLMTVLNKEDWQSMK